VTQHGYNSDEMTAYPVSPEPALDDRFVETLLMGTAIPVGAAALEYGSVAEALADLRSFGNGPAPTPSPALAALLDPVVVPLHPSVQVRRRSHRGAWISAAAAALVVGTGVAAAQQALPEGMQHLVSSVINDVTPFHVPTTSHSTDHRNGPNPLLPSQADFGQSHKPTSVPQANGSNGRKVGPPASNDANRSGGVGTSSPPVPGQTHDVTPSGKPSASSTETAPAATPTDTKPTSHPTQANNSKSGGHTATSTASAAPTKTAGTSGGGTSGGGKTSGAPGAATHS